MVSSTASRPDPVGAYLDGIARARSWRAGVFEAMQEAVSRNPYGVLKAVNETFREDRATPSRQQMLKYGGTTNRIGRGSVIKNTHNAAWGAIFGATGLRVPVRDLLDVVTKAGAEIDEAFQFATATWTTSSGDEVTGAVFNWDRWNGKKWVPDE